MSNGGSYYALTLAANGTSSPAYYGITPTPNLSIAQGGATIVPTAAAPTIVSIYPQELQIQAPPGSISGGVTIITSEGFITGHFGVSPPINVALTLTAYGAGGHQIGQSIVDPGVEGNTFSFPVDGTQAMNSDDADAVLKKILGNK